jgi:hypothetical protein
LITSGWHNAASSASLFLAISSLASASAWACSLNSLSISAS